MPKMKPYYADLHIHSKYSRATSPQCDLGNLLYWAQLKGISICGTGDCTHPLWFSALKRNLEFNDDNGLYQPRRSSADRISRKVPENCRSPVHFMITGEISSIYKRDGKTRKVHSIIIMPTIEAAGKLNTRLTQIGNIISDGRPILGVDPRDLLEIMLEIDPRSALIPAHIWTPWFSMLGSKSGFDSLEECFGGLSKYIFAVETGLSSDIPMNNRIQFLRNITFISNSDLHSPSKLARNATRFFGKPSYNNVLLALKQRSPQIFGGTVDLFPEDGKYFFDGHRSCGIAQSPEQSIAANNICPACGKPLTIGVLHRVVELEKESGIHAENESTNCQPFHYIIPLEELLSQHYDVNASSKRVQREYMRIIERSLPELNLLIDADEDMLNELGDIGLMISKVRRKEVIRSPGYDGVYGFIKVH